jgi:hypothetical protein
MAKTKISEYSATPADNTDISNINIAEGCSPANVNNAIRSLMAQIKDLQAGTSGDTIPITAGGTGSTTAGAAKTALGAASSGANSDITSLTGLTTALSAAQGGTGLTTFTAGTTYVAPATATTFTATQTFTGSTTALAAVFQDAAEVTTISATAATGTINYDVTTQSVLYYTTSASANWTLNIRGNGTTSLNTLMSTGQAVTVVFLVTQGATAYYNNALTIDGSSVTPKYQGGSAWTSGNVSGIDIYSYTIIKTGSATFTVLASQVQFK